MPMSHPVHVQYRRRVEHVAAQLYFKTYVVKYVTFTLGFLLFADAIHG